MSKKVCPNGHVYDTDIYGDQCPLCPKGGAANDVFPAPGPDMSGGFAPSPDNGGGHTSILPPKPAMPPVGMPDASGETILKNNMGGMGQGYQPSQPHAGGTMIRQPKGAVAGNGRKLVGFLVTYNRNPMGKAYEIYEGKNYVGRDKGSDIAIPDDNQMSGRHMSILYRNVDNKFKYRDEQSSNGTFVNKELSDEGELQNFDIIRLGNTVFIFIAIPQLG